MSFDGAAGDVAQRGAQLGARRIGAAQTRDQHLAEVRVGLEPAGESNRVRQTHARREPDGARRADVALHGHAPADALAHAKHAHDVARLERKRRRRLRIRLRRRDVDDDARALASCRADRAAECATPARAGATLPA